MNIREWVDEFADGLDTPIQTMDGFDDCIVGIVQRFNDTFVVYDREKVLKKLMDRDGMTHEEAVEFWAFNQIGAWVGDGTPGFLVTPDSPCAEPISEDDTLQGEL